MYVALIQTRYGLVGVCSGDTYLDTSDKARALGVTAHIAPVHTFNPGDLAAARRICLELTGIRAVSRLRAEVPGLTPKRAHDLVGVALALNEAEAMAKAAQTAREAADEREAAQVS